jgi:hypothetical protein
MKRPKVRTAPAWYDKLLRWVYHGRDVDGLWVGAWDEPILERTIEALRLIELHDPLRYRRMTQDLHRVLVQRFLPGALGNFNARLRACLLNENFVAHDDTTLQMIAATIVHEATHARLDKCRIAYEESLRARIEAVCFRREIAFAAKLPDGAVVRELAERKLTFYADPAYWTDAAFHNRDLTEIPEALRQLGAPEWLARILLGLKVFSRRLRATLQEIRRVVRGMR